MLDSRIADSISLVNTTQFYHANRSSSSRKPKDRMAAETYKFRFKDLDLEGFLVGWNDTIGIRLARHSYLKRDGAEQEPMGAEPGRFTMRIALMGASW